MKKLKMLLVSIIILFSITGVVDAICLDKANMNITIPEQFIPTQEHTKWLEEKQMSKEQAIYLLEKQGILWDGITQDASKELCVSQAENASTKKVFHMHSLQETEQNALLEKYKELEYNNGFELLDSRKIEVNGMVYFNMKIATEDMQSNIYYTIVNGLSYTFTINYMGQTNQIVPEELEQIINSVTFNEIQPKVVQDLASYYSSTILIVIFILATIVYTKIKNGTLKKNLKEKSNQIEALNNKFTKFGGIQIVFLIFTIISTIILIRNGALMLQTYLTQGTAMTWEKLYSYLFILQVLLQITLLIHNIFLVLKRKQTSLKNIKRNLILIAVIGTIIPCIRMSFANGIYGNNSLNKDYYITEMQAIAQDIIYVAIWLTYFMMSVRTKGYYLGEKVEDILTKPKMSYKDKLKKREEEKQEIINWFEQKDSINLQHALTQEEISMPYRNSIAFEELRKRGIIKKKNKKYYLNKNALNNMLYGTFRSTINMFLPVIILLIIIATVLAFL